MRRKMIVRRIYGDDINMIRIDNNVLDIIYNPNNNKPNVGFKGIVMKMGKYMLFLDESYIDWGRSGKECHKYLEVRRK